MTWQSFSPNKARSGAAALRARKLGSVVPAHILAAADRAAQGGPVPTDPEVRGAAARIAEEQLELMRRGTPLLLLGLFSADRRADAGQCDR